MGKTDTHRMRGGIRRRGAHGAWSYMVDLGPQAAVRCNACGARQWVGHERPTVCAKCSGGSLRSTKERRQLVVGGFATRRAAEEARAEKLHTVREGTFVPPSRLTLADYLRDYWLPGLGSEDLKPTTIAGYERAARLNLIGPPEAPYRLGSMRLQKLTRDAVRAHYVALAKHGRQGGNGGLGPASLRAVQATLTRALGDAVESGLVARNVAAGATRHLHTGATTKAERGIKAWSLAELGAFLGAVRDDRLHALWHLMAMTGCRRGEALALRWNDVDLEAGRVSITKQRILLNKELLEYPPKSKRSTRTVALDGETVEVLKRHAAAQSVELAAGEPCGDPYVFTTPGGEPWNPNHVSDAFDALVAALPLPRITLHGLRHTYATNALAGGMPLHVVSQRLGHASPAITLNVYANWIPGHDEDLATAFAAAVKTGTF